MPEAFKVNKHSFDLDGRSRRPYVPVEVSKICLFVYICLETLILCIAGCPVNEQVPIKFVAIRHGIECSKNLSSVCVLFYRFQVTNRSTKTTRIMKKNTTVLLFFPLLPPSKSMTPSSFALWGCGEAPRMHLTGFHVGLSVKNTMPQHQVN